ncbi:ral guanine nucleotide dissociation stimulator-like 3 isoform X6 [Rhinolophus sinicus]|uniref:ral guanine nucleotide dissociation stimulator-like 3 isoform X6 n=1 Tax=Rhinolophus sinicus TaxID=89399 RepID=UPI003D7B0279
MQRTAGKELALAPLQDWGEETENGAVYSVSLRRQRSQRLSPGEGPQDSQAPSPSADAFLHYRTSKVRALRAARLERLVWELVSGDSQQDPSFVPAFLATHRAFVPTDRVLGLLLPPPPPPLPPWVEIKKTEGQDLSFNKNLRAVVSVLGSWLRDHPQDFWDPPAHSNLGSVRTFLGWAAPLGTEALEAEKLLGDFLEEAEREQEEEEQPQAWAGFPETAQTPSPDSREGCLEEEEKLVQEGPELLDFSVDEVAEQLTLMDARCRELRNFSSLRAILSALQSNPIYRLKSSWGAVSREPLSTFRKLSQIFSDENNHLSSREILSQEEATDRLQEADTPPGSLPSKLPPGPVPYLGTFLTDLVMLDTALPDMLEGDLINFEKRRKEWEILARIQQLQRRCRGYCLSPRPPILATLRAQRQLSEEQSYRISRVIEPPAASCPSSPRVRRRISLTKRLTSAPVPILRKLSRERGSSPGGSPGDPSSPTSSLSPGSPPSSPRTRDPPPRSPPASPGPQGPSTKVPGLPVCMWDCGHPGRYVCVHRLWGQECTEEIVLRLGSALRVSLHGTMCIFMAPTEELFLHLACTQTWTRVSAHPQGTPGCNHTLLHEYVYTQKFAYLKEKCGHVYPKYPQDHVQGCSWICTCVSM